MRIAGTVAGALLALGIAIGAAAAVPAFVADEVELRWGPDEEFPAQAIVPQGTQVEVLQCAGAWCRAAFEDAEGFLPREILNFLSPEPVPLIEEFEGYDFLDDGYVYGPGFAFPRFGGLHRRGESRASFHDRAASRTRFHSRAISGARFHSRGESAGRAHNRAFSGQVHSRYSSRGPVGERRVPRRDWDRDRDRRPDNLNQRRDLRPKNNDFQPRRDRDNRPRRERDFQKSPLVPPQKQRIAPPQKQRNLPPPQKQRNVPPQQKQFVPRSQPQKQMTPPRTAPPQKQRPPSPLGQKKKN
jgi:hypothetical protein